MAFFRTITTRYVNIALGGFWLKEGLQRFAFLKVFIFIKRLISLKKQWAVIAGQAKKHMRVGKEAKQVQGIFTFK